MPAANLLTVTSMHLSVTIPYTPAKKTPEALTSN
jgi:hypothetical protein